MLDSVPGTALGKRVDFDRNGGKHSDESQVSKLAQDCATREQQLCRAVNEKSHLESALFKSVKESLTLKSANEQMQRKYETLERQFTELRLRSIDYKKEVDRRVSQLMIHCESRLGYLPTVVARDAAYIRMLRAPPSKKYDDKRVESVNDHVHPHQYCKSCHRYGGHGANRIVGDPNADNPWRQIVHEAELLPNYSSNGDEHAPASKLLHIMGKRRQDADEISMGGQQGQLSYST